MISCIDLYDILGIIGQKRVIYRLALTTISWSLMP